MSSAPAMGFQSSPEMERFLCGRLLDAAQPIAERFRALFSLRNLRGDAPRQALLQGIVSHRFSSCWPAGISSAAVLSKPLVSLGGE
jgi:hypothetical protein